MSAHVCRVMGLPATLLALLLLVFAQVGGVQGMSGPAGQAMAHHSLGVLVTADPVPVDLAAASHGHSSPVPYQATGSHDRSGSPVTGEIAGCMVSCYAMLVPAAFFARPGARRIASHVDSADTVRARTILPRPEPPKTRS